MQDAFEGKSYGEWFRAGLDLSREGMLQRERAARDAALPHFEQARLSGIESIAGKASLAAGCEAYFPSADPSIGLYSLHDNLVQLTGSAYVLADQRGACLVTALHVVFDERTGQYRDELTRHGLFARTPDGEGLELGGSTWSGYDGPDVAIAELSPEQVRQFGGALDMVHAAEPPALWVAYGYSASVNRQRHRLDTFTPHAHRIGLYQETEPPRTFKGDPSKFLFFKYDHRRAFDSTAGRTQATAHPRGHSGGLVAGYIASLACWVPMGTVIEWHRDPPTLVASRLDSVFAAL